MLQRRFEELKSRRNNYTNGGVCAAEIKEPFVVETDESFGEGGAGDVLPGLFIRPFGLEYRSFGSVDQVSRIMGVEESLACGVCIGAEVRIAMFGIVLAVIEDDDAGLREDRRRSGFREATVEVAWPFGEDLDGISVSVFNRGPVDEIG